MRTLLRLMLVLLPVCSLTPLFAKSAINPILSYQFFFQKEENFQVGFADYPRGQEDFFELTYKQNSQIPFEIYTVHEGLMISGNNHSDDLFMYTHKKIGGLKPNTTYRTSFSLVFATNTSANCAGVGGSPGSSVYVKAGLVSQRPQRHLDENQYYRMSLDKGNQAMGGTDMILLGHLGIDREDCIDWYSLKSLTNHDKEFIFHSNAAGNAWVIIGTDSGYESTTTLYYTSLTLNLIEVE